jgi:hypothetical protein
MKTGAETRGAEALKDNEREHEEKRRNATYRWFLLYPRLVGAYTRARVWNRFQNLKRPSTSA